MTFPNVRRMPEGVSPDHDDYIAAFEATVWSDFVAAAVAGRGGYRFTAEQGAEYADLMLSEFRKRFVRTPEKE